MRSTQAEFEKWMGHLKENGFSPIRITCENCGGDGLETCECCGSYVTCDDCSGEGSSVFPTIQDYEKFKSVELRLMEMWREGVPVSHGKNNIHLPLFLDTSEPMVKDGAVPATQPRDFRPFTIHIIGRTT